MIVIFGLSLPDEQRAELEELYFIRMSLRITLALSGPGSVIACLHRSQWLKSRS